MRGIRRKDERKKKGLKGNDMTQEKEAKKSRTMWKMKYSLECPK